MKRSINNTTNILVAKNSRLEVAEDELVMYKTKE